MTKAGRDRRGHLIFFITALGLLALDLWSKEKAFSTVPPHGAIQVWEGVLEFRLTLNPGMMWGGFQNVPALWWVAIRGLVFVGLMWLYFSLPQHGRLVQLAFGLVTAGALGNVYDNIFSGLDQAGGRLFSGAVRDFIRFYWFEFPTFNVADSCICVGAPLLLIVLWNHDRQAAAARRAAENRSSSDARG